MGDKPWLARKGWRENKIKSSAKGGLLVMWVFALFWNGISFPIVFGASGILNDAAANPMVYVAFIFPLIGVGLVVSAFNMTRQWLRFGATPLELDPFPGSLGGHVGGSVEINTPYHHSDQFHVQLNCVYSYMSGSGKNRSRKEDIKWQTTGVCRVEPGAKGSRISFRFDVPSDLPASDAKRGSSYHLWRVSVRAELPGADYDRSFDIPVYPTAEQSVRLHEGTEDHYATEELARTGVETVADISPIPGGIAVRFPAFTRLSQSVPMAIFGVVFAAIGIGVGMDGDTLVIPLVFTALGIGLAGAGIYKLCKSLEVRVTSQGIQSRRFFLGYPITTRRVEADNVTAFRIEDDGSTSSGSKSTVYYTLLAETHGGTKPIRVAERLASRREAELLEETYRGYL